MFPMLTVTFSEFNTASVDTVNMVFVHYRASIACAFEAFPQRECCYY